MNHFKIIILSLGLIALFSCAKENDQTGVPFVEVNYTLNIDDPELIKLRTVGNWEYITGGSRGILVYRATEDEFIAYDRHCTYDPVESCSQLDVDATDIRMNDYDCCGSEFSIVNGSILKGPASIALKRYNTTFDGTRIIITN